LLKLSFRKLKEVRSTLGKGRNSKTKSNAKSFAFGAAHFKGLVKPTPSTFKASVQCLVQNKTKRKNFNISG